MHNLHVTFSNDIKQLFDALASSIREPLDGENFLAPEYVLLDNKVLGGWLNLQLAQRHSVAANIEYIQPSSLFWTLAKSLLGDELPAETPLLKDEMKWRLFALLGDNSLLELECMSPVKHYLEGETNKDLKRYQLAASIADLFDQYLIFRADWLLSWQETPDRNVTSDSHEQWQKALWRRLTASAAGKPPLLHRAAIEKKLHLALQNGDQQTINSRLPVKRLYVFGITTMAPSMLQLLQLLGTHIPVYLYVLNPCQEFWFDCKSPKEWLHNKSARIERDIPLVIGNPLLLSNGQQVREFIEKIVADEGYDYQVTEEYVEPGSASLLHCIQQDILTLTQAGVITSLSPFDVHNRQKREVPACEFAPGKMPSVHIHSCHSAMREVEVLRDQLLDMFRQDATLKPRDVVVMMPQTGKYMPYIEAVFGNTPEQLPYHITDLSLIEESPLLNSLDILLGLPKSRFALSEILAILEVPAVQARFDLDRNGYEQLKSLLVKSGARWGLDADHRQAEGLPAYSDFSWEFAINRLISGFAMSAQDNDDSMVLVAMERGLTVAPLDEIEGASSELLNSFLRFWQTLLHYRQQMQRPQTAIAWSELLAAMLDSFFIIENDDELRAVREIRQQLQTLRKAGIEQWHSGNITLDVVRDFLQTVMQVATHRTHQWREGIKFCSLMPMRGVPFRVIYILGMNQGEYPGRVEKKSFDLMRHQHRTGDRSRRVDDRWLFLEALLSARDIFHLSYVGHDQRKNEERQPSVLVAELLDYLRDGYAAPVESFITSHPLQPFSKDYFLANKQKGQGRLVSYNAQAFAIANTVSAEVGHGQAVWPSSQVAAETVEITVEDFVRFFTEPAKWFFNNKHKTWLTIQDNKVSDEEMLEMNNGLDAWSARNTIKSMALTSDASIHELVDTLAAQWQAQGRWPLGNAGNGFRSSLKQEISHAWLDAAKLPQEPQALLIDQHFASRYGKLRIRGSVSLVGNGIIEHSASSKKIKYTLGFYLRCALAASSQPAIDHGCISFFKKRDVDVIELRLAGDFHASLLNELAELYLLYRDHGLPFAPELSHAIYTAEQEDKSIEDLLENSWYGDFNSDGLIGDINSRAYYMQIERLQSGTFQKVSVQIWQALEQWLTHAKPADEAEHTGEAEHTPQEAST